MTITFSSPLLQPVYPGANNVTLHVWTPGDISLSVSDNVLERVTGWRQPTCGSGDSDRYQTARIMATAEFTSGNSQFTANILPIIAHRVS